MRAALFLRDGRTQVILTAENQIEEMALKAIEENSGETSFHRGEFYACRGGWERQGQVLSGTVSPKDQSLMIVLDK